MSGFNNPIIGGGGGLVYPSIHSPNFITGVSGWTINKDGSAEFNNLTVRGTFFGTDWIMNANGLFFYNGTPANNNLIIAIAPVATTDPFGTFVAQGASVVDPVGGGSINLNAAIMTLAGGINVFHRLSPLGDFTYDSSGNLIASIAPASGANDGLGHAFQAGITQIATAAGNQFMNLLNGALNMGNSTSVLLGKFQDQGHGNAGWLTSTFGAGDLQGQVILNSKNVSSDGVFPEFELLETRLHIFRLAVAEAIGLQVIGDTFNRWQVDTDGTEHAGSGSAAMDTVKYRSGVGTWASDPIQGNLAGIGETPHSMAVRGYQNGWLDGGRQPGRYRIIASPPSTVELYGSLTIPVGFAVGQVIVNLPNAYHPANPQTIIGRNLSVAGALSALDYAANGNLTWQGSTAVSAAGNIIDFHGLVSLP